MSNGRLNGNVLCDGCTGDCWQGRACTCAPPAQPAPESDIDRHAEAVFCLAVLLFTAAFCALCVAGARFLAQ